jgi:HK97 family phage major capsid protein
MDIQSLIGTQETRFIPLDSTSDGATLTFSFSSEYAANRSWGKEILSHEPGAVDLSYLNSGVASFFWDHNRDALLGIVQKAWLQDKRCYGQVRWSDDQEAQRRKAQVDEGTLKGISCRYEIQQIRQLNNDTVIVERWKPLEITLTPMPVDPTVGVGRSIEPSESKISKTDRGTKPVEGEDDQKFKEQIEAARKAERERITSIRGYGERHNQQALAEQLINDGISLEEARAKLLDKITGAAPQPVGATVNPVNPLGLSDKEQRSYSILRAVEALVSGNWAKAGFEKECSDELVKRSGKTTAGILVPVRDLKVNTAIAEQIRATQAVSTPALGGNLVQTVLDSANFIDLLRNRAMVMRLGGRMLSGLVGNLDIPRQTTAGTVYWVPEDGNVTQTDIRFDLLQFRPKTMGMLYAITRLMMLQGTPDVEQLVRDDLRIGMALELDRVSLYGLGTGGEPRGIANTPGINSVAIGANGGAPTWATIVNLETEVAADNADIGTLGYLTNARTRGKLKTTEKATNTGIFLMPEVLSPDGMNQLNGYRAAISNQVRGDRVRGSGTNLSDIFYGNWSDLMIGEWGIMEVLPNPYGAGYEAGTVQIRALQTVDVQIRRVQSYCLCSDVSTN